MAPKTDTVAVTISNGFKTIEVSWIVHVEEATSVKSNGNELTFGLAQNYPNPFNPTTNIRYSIEKGSNVNLTVYNSLGQKVRTLLNEYKSPGRYEATFNGKGLSGGIYLVRLKTDARQQTRKMTLLK